MLEGGRQATKRLKQVRWGVSEKSEMLHGLLNVKAHHITFLDTG